MPAGYEEGWHSPAPALKLTHDVFQLNSRSAERDKHVEEEIGCLFGSTLRDPVFYGNDELGGLLAYLFEHLIDPFFVPQQPARIRAFARVGRPLADNLPEIPDHPGIHRIGLRRTHDSSCTSMTSPISRPQKRRQRSRAFSILQPAFPIAIPRSLFLFTSTFTGPSSGPRSIPTTSAGLKILAMNSSGCSAYSTISMRRPRTFWSRFMLSPFFPIARPMSPCRIT